MFITRLLFSSAFIVAGLLASSVQAKTKVLVPLYSWSEDCWPELQASAKANPTVSWILIINPNSGPIKDAQDPSLYCVPKLRQTMGSDVEIVGYVRTGYNDRNLREIKRDVDMYKSWNGIKVEGGKYPKLDGIFYDETSDTTTTRLKGFATYAKSAFGSNAKIISNPGTHVGNEYFNSATYVVDYESAYNRYDISNLPISATQLKQSIVMLHDVPSTASLSSILTPLVQKNVAAVFVTDLKIEEEDIYQRFGSNWSEFIEEVATLNA